VGRPVSAHFKHHVFALQGERAQGLAQFREVFLSVAVETLHRQQNPNSERLEKKWNQYASLQ
jgi:hypothetical protein